jgi:hypothetical protein
MGWAAFPVGKGLTEQGRNGFAGEVPGCHCGPDKEKNNRGFAGALMGDRADKKKVTEENRSQAFEV